MDKLVQVGKSLARTGQQAKDRQARYNYNYPLVERMRDCFTAAQPFQMEIKAIHDTNTRLNFFFMEPTPTCITSPCDDGFGACIGNFDNFARVVTHSSEAFYNCTFVGGTIDTDRTVALEKRDRDVVLRTTTIIGLGISSVWGTNFFGFDIIDDIEWVGGGWFPDPIPPVQYHHDREDRYFLSLKQGFRFPSNCTHATFMAGHTYAPRPPKWDRWNFSESRITTVLNVANGHWATGNAANWDDGVVVGGITIPEGVVSVDSYLDFPTPSGYPDFVIEVGGDLENGLGEEWIDSGGNLFLDIGFPPTVIQSRYPADRHADGYFFTDILGFDHHVWAQNEAVNGGSIDDSGVFLRVFFPGPPGWGTGPCITWDEAFAEGDDYSDSATVSGGTGILRIHPSPNAQTSFAEVSSSVTFLDSPIIISWGTKISSVGSPVTPYYDGVNFSGPVFGGPTIYPDNDTIVLNEVTATGGMDWTQKVWFKMAENSGGSFLQWWQDGTPEPAGWMLVSTSILADGDSDSPHFQLNAKGNYMEERTLYVYPKCQN